MDIRKILADELPSAYAVSRLTKDDKDYLLVASEVEEACFAYDVNNQFEKSVVWQDVGGTMSIIQVPGTLDFLATQKFYPGFNSKDCQIVYGKFEKGQWSISKLTDFPYLHRFDLIPQEDGKILFVGCTIANSKAYTEDWSDKGKVFVAEFAPELLRLVNLRELPLRLLKNHGYYDVKEEGYSLITAVEGVVKLTYPDFSDTGDWRLDLLFGEETSDIVQVDVNHDGQKENVIIQGFHGDAFRVLNQDFSKELYHYLEPTQFGHAIWSGELLGQPYFIFGWRSGKADLMIFQEEDGAIVPQMIDSNSASSNVLAFEKNGKAYIFSANNGRHEAALYELSK
ncbi:hypothetical protein [Streptococcus dentiloxodontae]